MIAVIWRMITVRRGHAITVALLAGLAIGAAVAAPVYLAESRASLIQSAIATAPPAERYLTAEEDTPVEAVPGDQDSEVAVGQAHQRAFDRTSLAHMTAPGFRSVFSIDFDVLAGQKPPENEAVAKLPSHTLMYRDDYCAMITLVAGRCVSGPAEVLASPALAKSLDVAVGDQFLLTPVQTAGSYPNRSQTIMGDVTPVTLVGLYTVPDPDSLYWGAAAGATMRDPAALPLLTDRAALATVHHRIEHELRIMYPVPGTLTVANLATVRTQVTDLLKANDPSLTIQSHMTDLLGRIDVAIAQVATAPTVGAALLTILCWFVIFLAVTQTAQARRAELGMLKLRGLTAPDQWWLAAAETAIPLCAGAVIGYVAAHLAIWGLARDDAGRAAVHLGTGPLPYALLALGGAVVVSLAALRRDLTSPAAELMRRVPPRGRRWQGGVGIVLALALTAVSVVQLRTAPAGPRSVVMLGAPALTILTAGLVAAVAFDALLGVVGTFVLRRGRLGLGLAALHLSRRNAGSRLLSLLTIAIALLGFAAIGSELSAISRHQEVDAAIGAPQVVQVGSITPMGLLQKVRGVDPTGRYAMAVMLQPTLDGDTSLAFDAAAAGNVMFWPEPDSLSQAAAIKGLRTSTPAPMTVISGTSMHLTATAAIPPNSAMAATGAVVPLDGTPPTRFNLAFTPGRHTYAIQVPCAKGCRLGTFGLDTLNFGSAEGNPDQFALTLNEIGEGPPNRVVTTAAQFGQWQDHSVGAVLQLAPAADGLHITFTGMARERDTLVAPPDSPSTVNLLTAGPHTSPSLPGEPGNTIRTTPVGKISAIPRLGTAGVLLELDTLTRGDAVLFPLEGGEVWLSADAPADTVAKLEAAGLVVLGQRSEASELKLRNQEPSAIGLAFFLGVATLGIVLGLAGLIVSAGVERAARAEELRALRAQGMRRRTAFASGLWGYLITIAAAAVLGGAIAEGAWWLTGSAVPTVDEGSHTVVPPWWLGDQTVRAWAVASVVLIAAGVALVVALMRAVGRNPRDSAPAEADVITRAEFPRARSAPPSEATPVGGRHSAP